MANKTNTSCVNSWAHETGSVIGHHQVWNYPAVVTVLHPPHQRPQYWKENIRSELWWMEKHGLKPTNRVVIHRVGHRQGAAAYYALKGTRPCRRPKQVPHYTGQVHPVVVPCLLEIFTHSVSDMLHSSLALIWGVKCKNMHCHGPGLSWAKQKLHQRWNCQTPPENIFAYFAHKFLLDPRWMNLTASCYREKNSNKQQQSSRGGLIGPPAPTETACCQQHELSSLWGRQLPVTLWAYPTHCKTNKKSNNKNAIQGQSCLSASFLFSLMLVPI